MSQQHAAVARAWTEAGFETVTDRRDPGVLRAYLPNRGPLIGMAVVRAEQVTYAEHRGRVFRFMIGDSQRATLDALYRHIRENPAT